MRKYTQLLAAVVASLSLVVASIASAKSYTTRGAWSFVSAPGVNPPKLKTNHRRGKLAQGYFMLANTKDLAFTKETMVGEGGPLILNSHLQPVWFDPVKLSVATRGGVEVASNVTFNLRAQTYQGQPVLSWWQGTLTNNGATLAGKDIVVNQHYQRVATLSATGPAGCTGTGCWVLSGHEFLIAGQDAWVTAYRNVPMDLRKYGGPQKGTLIDTAVQEYDLKTGQLIFNWDALQHVPLSDSHSRPLKNGTWDAYHENSINLGNGSFLVSMRNDWTAYEVNETTGTVLWKLSGDPKLSTFKVPSNARFQWQHDVEIHPGNLVTVFDDHCCNVVGSGKLAPPSGPPSRGLVLKLDFAHHTAKLAGRYARGSTYVPFLGNTQMLPGGNVLVGWGVGPFFSEYTRSGTLLLDAVMPDPDQSYRAYLQGWVGLPNTLPSGAVRKSKGKTTVYASWNGATKVVSWRVLAGSSETHVSTTLVKGASKTGFETAIPVKGSHKFYELQALSSGHKVLGSSKPFSTSSHPALVGGY